MARNRMALTEMLDEVRNGGAQRGHVGAWREMAGTARERERVQRGH